MQHQNKHRTVIKYATFKTTLRIPTTHRVNRICPKRFAEAHKILSADDPFSFTYAQPNHKTERFKTIKDKKLTDCLAAYRSKQFKQPVRDIANF